jgi:hypothetical protein
VLKVGEVACVIAANSRLGCKAAGHKDTAKAVQL